MRFIISILLSGLLALPAIGKPARRPTYEPLPASPTAIRKNLLLNAATSASGHWSDRLPSFATDGDRSPGNHWACENLPVWHMVSLAEPKKLSAIHIWPYWGDGRVYQYQIEGSEDGTAWKTLGDMSANSIASTAEGTLFQFEPITIRHIRTTFTHNSLSKSMGGHIVEIEGYADVPDVRLAGGIGSTDLRYPPAGKVEGLRPASEGISLTGWRGERVSTQIVLTSDAPQRSLRFDPLVLANGSSQIQGNSRFVRYTLANGKPQGDILDDAISLDLSAGSNRPAWVDFQIPADASAGTYTGKLVARTDGSVLEFPIKLDVLAATLPAPSAWSFHLDLWQQPASVARWHDVPEWSDEHLALLKPSMRRLADAGQKTITTTLIDEAWGGQTYDRFPGMIQWRKKADGTWNYDYSVFDRWVAFASTECGLGSARIHGYSMIPWSLTFPYYDETKQAMVEVKLSPGTPAYDEHWGMFLKDFTRHLRAKGWLERMRIGVDERPDHLMRGALATLAKHAPELRVASAINHPSALTRELDDISPIIQHTGEFSAALLEERRAAGRKTTFYVCTSPPVPNTFTFSPPAESEWLPLFASAQGFDGFLRWAYHSWVENPLVSTDFTSWPSGDCFLVYPGDRSSIRFERLRDGIESFEKIRLLRALAKRNPGPALKTALDELEKVLADFTWERGSKSGPHTDDVQRVNAAILKATQAAGKL